MGKLISIGASVAFTLVVLYAVSRTSYAPTFGLTKPPATA